MITLIFTEPNIIDFEPSVLLVPEFKALLDADTSEDKSKFRAQLTHLFLINELDYTKNPLAVLQPESKRLQAVRISNVQPEWIEESLYLEAEAMLMLCNTTPEHKALQVIDQKIYQIVECLDNLEPVVERVVDKKGGVKWVSNTKEMQEYKKILEDYAKTKKSLLEVISNYVPDKDTKKTRGNVKPSMLEERANSLRSTSNNAS